MTYPATGTGVAELWQKLAARIAAGDRFAGLFAAVRSPHATGPHAGDPHATGPHPDGPHSGGPYSGDAAAQAAVVLSAHVAAGARIDTMEVALPPGAPGYPALTPVVGAAFWYERVIHDEFGVVPRGHPRLAPLVLHGSPEDHVLPRNVAGYGMFTIPHGPVRSGVMESIEYLVETPGEAIPHLNMRVFYKHRGVEKRFTGMSAADGALLAERTEGIASVAHALAYCHAIERMAGCAPPEAAGLVRVLHAELERIANHVDVAAKLADAAGLAVAAARFAFHKERVLRLVSGLCGNRFGRGVVVPGGVSALPRMSPGAILAESSRLEKAVMADADSLMATSSFLDRLRTTGPLTPVRAREHGALGPIGKASGFSRDARAERPYDAYPSLGVVPIRAHETGDALARLAVRWDETVQSFDLLRQAAGQLASKAGGELASKAGGELASTVAGAGATVATCEPVAGRAVGWAEAPQGEVLYDVTLEDGRISRCHPRSASFHNLVLMHDVFAGDILTDFPFIEASFGLSVAGVAL